MLFFPPSCDHADLTRCRHNRRARSRRAGRAHGLRRHLLVGVILDLDRRRSTHPRASRGPGAPRPTRSFRALTSPSGCLVQQLRPRHGSLHARDTSADPTSAVGPDADMDPATRRLIAALQAQDLAGSSRPKRERSAPDSYFSPPPGEQGLAKASDRPAKRDDRRETRARDAKPLLHTRGRARARANPRQDRTLFGVRSPEERGEAGAAAPTRADHPPPPSPRDPGRTSPCPVTDDPRERSTRRFKHHLNEVWVQSTRRAGGRRPQRSHL